MLKFYSMTAIAVLAATAGVAQSSDGDEMRNLTSNVLAGITGTPLEPVQTEAADTNALRNLVEQAQSEGQSDAYLDALINEAANTGQIKVPEELRTTEGAVDTKTLLASLVAKSLDQEASDGDVAALDAAAAGEDQEERLYTVQPGDSLAAISLVYYDTTRDFRRIFDANRDTISSPDRIQVGQIIRIPR